MRIIVGVILICISGFSFGQQLPVFSQWQNNLYTINPAIAGYDMYMDISLHGKKQWVGLENSPFNQMLTVHSSINEMPIGVGGGFFNDNIGTIKHSGFMGTFAYHAKVGEETKLGFGITSRLSFYGIDLDKVAVTDNNDPLLSSNMRSGLVPDISFGVLLHRYDYFVGLSAQNLLSSKVGFDPNYQIADIMHLNMMAGWRIEANQAIGFTPAIYVSRIESYPIFVDFRFSSHYNNRFDFDLGYRSSGDVILGVGIEIIDYLKFHYAYDIITSNLRSGTSGSHEILLSYDFYYNPLYKGSKKRYKWIKKGPKPKLDKD